jgi:hypothetical protein
MYPPSDAVYYPLYAKCAEIDLPLCVNTGLPGPPIPGEAQNPIHLDRVCVRFPELRLCMIHGADPWWDVAIRIAEAPSRLPSPRTPMTIPFWARTPAATAAITPGPPPQTTVAPARASSSPTRKALARSSSVHDAGPHTATWNPTPQPPLRLFPARLPPSRRVRPRQSG